MEGRNSETDSTTRKLSGAMPSRLGVDLTPVRISHQLLRCGKSGVWQPVDSAPAHTTGRGKRGRVSGHMRGEQQMLDASRAYGNSASCHRQKAHVLVAPTMNGHKSKWEARTKASGR